MAFGEHRRAMLPNNADVQVEFTGMAFDGLLPTIMFGGVGVAGATCVLGILYNDHFLILLTFAMIGAVILRMTITSLFLKRKGCNMNVREASRWEVCYGAATCLYASLLAVSSVYNFKHHDHVAQLWCVVGTIVLSAGIGARLALQPWIGYVSCMIMLLPLTFSVLSSPELLVKLTSILLGLYFLTYCESVRTKFTIVIDQIRTKRQLASLAEQDALTGLANRRQFETMLRSACTQNKQFAILYIDLDKFKVVNDTHGHRIGDGLLKAVAAQLQAMVRESDLVARLGGDEFAILQGVSATTESATLLAKRINQELAKPFEVESHSLQIGASVGIYLNTDEDADPSMLLSNADSALYEVKKRGRGGFCIAPPISRTPGSVARLCVMNVPTVDSVPAECSV